MLRGQVFQLQARGKQRCKGQGAWFLKMLKSDVVGLSKQDAVAFDVFNENLGSATAFLSDHEESKVCKWC